MPFVVNQHRVDGLPSDPKLPRHVPTLEAGIELVGRLSTFAVRQNRLLNCHLGRSVAVPKEPKPPRQPKPVPFPTTRFLCVMANSVAQVWLCTKAPWEAGQIGRRKKNGKPPEADKLPHMHGDYAVLKGDVPVVDSKRVPVVYRTWMEAELVADQLYYETPEEERYPKGKTTVYENMNFSVHFDPDNNGSNRPFNIYSTRHHKQVLDASDNVPWLFKTITSAVREADRLDKEARGIGA